MQIEDIREHFNASRDANFNDRVCANTMRYIDLFSQVMDELMPKPSVNFKNEQTPFDILME